MIKELESISVGSLAPDFTATDLDGNTVVLSGILEDRLMVLDFWATWCVPCLQAFPEVQKLHEEFAPRGVEFVAVSLRENPDDVRRFIERTGYTVRVVADTDGAIGSRYGVMAIPSIVVVGQDGRVELITVGHSPEREGALRQLLEQISPVRSLIAQEEAKE